MQVWGPRRAHRVRRLIRSNGLNIMAQTFYRRPAFCIPWAHEAAMASNQQSDDSPLAPYRALDLTEGGFNWCGKVLADMGADVIKVEPVGGSSARFRGPFYKDDPHPEKSLFWWAYCVNKRGITLDHRVRRRPGAFQEAGRQVRLHPGVFQTRVHGQPRPGVRGPVGG